MARYACSVLADGNVWQSSASVSVPGADLRDPKLSTTSYGRLLLLAEAVSDGAAAPAHRTLAWSSPDSREWEGPAQAGDPGMRLGRVTWHLNRAYSVGYGSPGPGPVRLYSSGDGERFTVQADNLLPPRQDAEAGLLFGRDGSALCLLRGEGPDLPPNSASPARLTEPGRGAASTPLCPRRTCWNSPTAA